MRVVSSYNNFFITTVGTPIRKIFDVLNRQVSKRGLTLPDGQPLVVSGSLLRKAVQTATAEHDATVVTNVARHLQHTEETVTRHYIVPNAESAQQ